MSGCASDIVGYLAELLGGPRDREVVILDQYRAEIRKPVGVYLPREGPDAVTRVLHYDWQGL